MRGVTISLLNDLLLEDISTHTPHARRDQNGWLNANDIRISTHTPHARRDARIAERGAHPRISTHTPHARRDSGWGVDMSLCKINFYSHASCEA